MTAPTPPQLVPWYSDPLPKVDPSTTDQTLYLNTVQGYHHSIINRDSTDSHSVDFQSGSRFELRIGTQTFTATTVGDRAVLDVPASAVKSIPDGPWCHAHAVVTEQTTNTMTTTPDAGGPGGRRVEPRC